MGEERQSGYVTAKSGSTTVVIYLGGRISPRCLEELRRLIREWAERCNVLISNVGVVKGKKKKKKKKK
jgi:hypothetical protein